MKAGSIYCGQLEVSGPAVRPVFWLHLVWIYPEVSDLGHGLDDLCWEVSHNITLAAAAGGGHY